MLPDEIIGALCAIGIAAKAGFRIGDWASIFTPTVAVQARPIGIGLVKKLVVILRQTGHFPIDIGFKALNHNAGLRCNPGKRVGVIAGRRIGPRLGTRTGNGTNNMGAMSMLVTPITTRSQNIVTPVLSRAADRPPKWGHEIG